MKEESNIPILLNEIGTLRKAYELIERETGNEFNIFSILGIETNEVSTHSRFIAELLNVKGKHGLKDVFLKLFLRTIQKEAPEFSFDTEQSTIFIEYHVGKVEETEGGRIDILIKDSANNVIMIENKIYATEQPNQLLRYKNAFKNGYLIYLTLDGDNSNENHNEIAYQPISYKSEIIDWLKLCKKETVNNPLLRETIQQYINLIQKLTHQNTNSKMSEEITRIILRDEEQILAYSTLIDLDEKIRKKMISKILETLRDNIERKFNCEFTASDLIADKGLLFSLENTQLKESNLTIKFNFERTQYSSLIFGFANKNNTQSKDEVLLKLSKENFPTAKQSDWWNVYIPLEKYFNWDYTTLGKIYFDTNSQFYPEIESLIEQLLSIINKRTLTLK
jgi:hypothetical protein